MAGRADDSVFAWLEHMAKQIEVSFPGIFFRFEMKHPDAWKDFIRTVFDKYDFRGFGDDFPGPLVWTHEGELIGGHFEFFQTVCKTKFQLEYDLDREDPLFKQIAKDNLRQVCLQLHRDLHGAPFSELCATALALAKQAKLLNERAPADVRRVLVGSAMAEVWICPELTQERIDLRKNFSKGQSTSFDDRLVVGPVGLEETHLALLHPRPLSSKHLVLVQTRHVVGPSIEQDDRTPSKKSYVSKLEGPAKSDVGDREKRSEAAKSESRSSPPPSRHPAEDLHPARVPRGQLMVPPLQFGEQHPDEDLGLEDFISAAEVMLNVPGVATWVGLSKGTDYRHPLDTYMQVLPFPLRCSESSDADSGLHYPFELFLDRALRANDSQLSSLPFEHKFCALKSEGARPADLGKTALAAFETARNQQRCSCLLAFTQTWLLYVPLVDPPTPGALLYEMWLSLPPPPPCALLGVFVSEAIQAYPQTAALRASADGGLTAFVSNRAVLEGIPEVFEDEAQTMHTSEYAKALREPRISPEILNHPVEILRMWARP